MATKNLKEENKKETIIDGKDLILGRLGSVVAKRLLLGENITIVNCKDVVIIGNKKLIFEKYKNKRENKVIKKGPYFHRSSSDIVKRALRNMLPYKNQRGSEALKRLKCYNSVPSTLIKTEKEVIDSALVNYSKIFYFTKVGEISKYLGYNKE